MRFFDKKKDIKKTYFFKFFIIITDTFPFNTYVIF